MSNLSEEEKKAIEMIKSQKETVDECLIAMENPENYIVADKNSYIKDNYISKDKVKEKMNKIKEEDLEISNTDSEDVRIAKYEQRAILDFCEELLEERN